MLVPSIEARPGLRRVLSSLARIAFELKDEQQANAFVPERDWRESLIAGQRNVIQHYRRVLATHHMPPAERQAVLDRIALIEDEIRSLEQAEGKPPHQVAAE
jgi:hypothetical protein